MTTRDSGMDPDARSPEPADAGVREYPAWTPDEFKQLLREDAEYEAQEERRRRVEQSREETRRELERAERQVAEHRRQQQEAQARAEREELERARRAWDRRMAKATDR